MLIMFTLLRIHKDRIIAVALLLLGCGIIVLLYLVRGRILSFTIDMYKSSNHIDEVFIVWIFWTIALLNFILFPILGFRRALNNGLNPILWATICAVASLWGYIWLVLISKDGGKPIRSISKAKKSGRNKRTGRS